VRVLVYGAGAIGSFLGYLLARAGHEVTLVGRPALTRIVREQGLRLSVRVPPVPRSPAVGFGWTAGGEVFREAEPASRANVVWPHTTESMASLPAEERLWDLALLTVKVYDTWEATRDLAAFLPTGTPVLLVQNGVGGEELARQAHPPAHVISGVLTMSVSVSGPGQICLETSSGGLNLAPADASQSISRWAALFGSAGLRVATFRNYRSMKWSKLLLNLQANAIPAILDMDPGEEYRNPTLFAMEREAFLEALAVMRALNLRIVSFPNYPVRVLAWAMGHVPVPVLRPMMSRLVASGRGDKKPSLHLDLVSGRGQSEVRFLNGAVVDHALQMGLPVPVNRALLDTLLALQEQRLCWDEFRHCPERLLSVVRGG